MDWRTRIMPRLLALFPSVSVETVLIAIWDHFTSGTLERILRLFPAIHELEIIGHEDDFEQLDPQAFCHIFADSLSPRTPGNVVRNGVDRYMPHLRTLSLRNFDFSHRSTITKKKLYEDLLRAFERRQSAGLSNPTLKIVDSGLKGSWVRAWEAWVEVEPHATCRVIGENMPSDEGEGDESEAEDSE